MKVIVCVCVFNFLSANFSTYNNPVLLTCVYFSDETELRIKTKPDVWLTLVINFNADLISILY